MRSILKLGLLLVAGILIYNYFLGTPEEKEQSKVIFREVKDLGKSAVDLLKSEKAKYEDGKYDGALDKIGNVFESLRNKAEDIQDSQMLDKLAELEERRLALEKHLETSEVQEYSDSGEEQKDKEAIEQEWKDLIKETEELMEKMEKRQE
jgi:hypothetical protein